MEALFFFCNKFIGAGDFCSKIPILFPAIFFSKVQVFCNISGKQNVFLRNISNQRMQILYTVFSGIDSVNQDLSGQGIIES